MSVKTIIEEIKTKIAEGKEVRPESARIVREYDKAVNSLRSLPGSSLIAFLPIGTNSKSTRTVHAFTLKGGMIKSINKEIAWITGSKVNASGVLNITAGITGDVGKTLTEELNLALFDRKTGFRYYWVNLNG